MSKNQPIALRPGKRPVALASGVTPLPTHISREAPHPAIILSRSAPEKGCPAYDLRVGNVNVPNVSLEELFDYVSPYDLEVFENNVFTRERDDETARELAKKESRIRSCQIRWLEALGRSSGASSVVDYAESGSGGERSVSRNIHDNTDSDMVENGGEMSRGRNGRPRPTYTHLYKKGRAKRGLKDPMSSDKQVPARAFATKAYSQPGAAAAAAVKATAKPSSPKQPPRVEGT